MWGMPTLGLKFSHADSPGFRIDYNPALVLERTVRKIYNSDKNYRSKLENVCISSRKIETCLYI